MKSIAMNFVTKGWHWIPSSALSIGQTAIKETASRHGKIESKLTIGDIERVFGALVKLNDSDYQEVKDYLCGRKIPEDADYMIVAYKKIIRKSSDYIDPIFIKLSKVDYYKHEGEEISNLEDDGEHGFTGKNRFYDYFDLLFNQGLYYPDYSDHIPKNEAERKPETDSREGRG